MQPQPMLKVDNLTKRFGNLLAVNHVSFEIHPGELVGLIGPNGAGKTTLFNAITGIYSPDEGKVYLKGADITGKMPHKICRQGMSRTFQVTRAFTHMSVEDAVRVGAYNRCSEKEVQARVDEIVDFCELAPIRTRLCGDIGLASLRRVELARALATDPQILLLDETGAGLTATELASLMDILRAVNTQRGVTLCVVEHVMQMVMGICQRIVVLDSGEVIATGLPAEISTNPRVIEAYLGKRVLQ